MAGVCSTLHGADPPHRIVMMTTFFDCEFLSRQTLRLTPAGLTRTIGSLDVHLTRCSSLETRRSQVKSSQVKRSQAPSWAILKVGTGRDARLPIAFFSKREDRVVLASLASSGGIPDRRSPTAAALIADHDCGRRIQVAMFTGDNPAYTKWQSDITCAGCALGPVSLFCSPCP